jgi:SAM-dependent methyltransferase
VITPERASAIAHGDLPFHNPIAEPAVDALLDLVAPGNGDRALDVGCGRGELLIRLAERTGAGGLGVDASEAQIEVARRQAAARAPGGHLSFEARDAAAMVAPARSFALAACIGSTHALGGFQSTLTRLRELVRPGGYVVVGEGYWQQEPGAEVLDTFPATADDATSLPELLAAGAAHGLDVVYLTTAGDEDWARYEWTYVFNLDRYAREHPDEEGVEQLHDRIDRVRRRRLLAARDGETLGFALVAWRADGDLHARCLKNTVVGASTPSGIPAYAGISPAST